MLAKTCMIHVENEVELLIQFRVDVNMLSLDIEALFHRMKKDALRNSLFGVGA